MSTRGGADSSLEQVLGCDAEWDPHKVQRAPHVCGDHDQNIYIYNWQTQSRIQKPERLFHSVRAEKCAVDPWESLQRNQAGDVSFQCSHPVPPGACSSSC